MTTWMRVRSEYHALQAKVDRRLANGFAAMTSYTLGRGKNYSAGDSNGTLQTPADPERSWGRRGEDRLHNFVVSWIYEIPTAVARPGGLWHHLAASWQISGIFVAQSGTPISFEAANASLHAPGNRQRPNVRGRPRVVGGIGPAHPWFDASVFSAPPENTWGNVPRNALLDGPAHVTVDAALTKTFTLPRQLRAEVRIDAFNLFNTPQFSNPDGTLGNATFGQIVNVIAGSERRIRFGVRVLY